MKSGHWQRIFKPKTHHNGWTYKASSNGELVNIHGKASHTLTYRMLAQLPRDRWDQFAIEFDLEHPSTIADLISKIKAETQCRNDTAKSLL